MIRKGRAIRLLPQPQQWFCKLYLRGERGAQIARPDLKIVKSTVDVEFADTVTLLVIGPVLPSYPIRGTTRTTYSPVSRTEIVATPLRLVRALTGSWPSNFTVTWVRNTGSPRSSTTRTWMFVVGPVLPCDEHATAPISAAARISLRICAPVE